MKKKQEDKPKKLYLTPEQFYKWKCYSDLIEIAELKYQLELAVRANNGYKMEIEKLRHELGLKKVHELSEKIEDARKSFTEIKSDIELSLGTTLENKVINNITFEIKEL